jgi:hypothetical protein
LIGLSATTRPLDRLAHYLTGAKREGRAPCEVVEVGHVRPWELWLETPDEELTAAPTHEMWGQMYDRLVELSTKHRTMLVFSNTRRLAERVAHDLGERIGHEFVAAHHGSMARELRLKAEERLKQGGLKIMVATASLELGLDGIIATNTTLSREGLQTPAEDVEAMGAGGLSGPPLTRRSSDVVRRLRSRVGRDLCIIAVGGIETAQDVRDRLADGATLVQGYTAFLYEGPFWAARITRGLSRGL